MELQDIRIGIADLNVASSPNRLITIGLGSCIGIALYDNISKIGGLAHIMLPNSKQFSNVTNPAKFADLAIPMLVNSMKSKGAREKNLRAKIAGGASMFNFSDKSMIMDIGNRNSQQVIETLNQMSIPIISQDIGGNKGRTMILYTENGKVEIKTVGMGVKEI
ncbi:chemotaxis protein CheD [Haloimpatiens lingqiaonensis]|uniref:chemotaxis protein CheD n=1 Tax=Haloimpatiens lingqiaonensis TaxID=1380675 RepID=UPI0010FE8F1C|nr:chemotaxis protein CheD [Haloimpatiens lingqiaonensis]